MCQRGRVCLDDRNDGRLAEDCEMVTALLRDRTLWGQNPLTAIKREVRLCMARRRAATRRQS